MQLPPTPAQTMPVSLPENFNYAGPEWRQISEYIVARIAELREQNDFPGMTEAQTGGIRGRIAELKQLLAMAQARPVVPHRNIYHNLK